jgi:protein SCO1/2
MYKTIVLMMLVACLMIPLAVGAQEPEESEEEWQPPISIKGNLGLTYADDLLGSVISPPRELADFTLPSSDGAQYTLSEHAGKIQLVYFGYMTCPDVCPATLADLLRAYREVGEPAEQVEVLFITIDPERDSLERLETYTSAFHENFIGLRPSSEDQLNDLMQNFGVVAQRREVDSALVYLMDHSATVFMVSPDGRLLAQYPFGVPYTEIAHDVQVMMDYTSSDSETVLISRGSAPTVNDLDREYRIVIPDGTGAQIMMGEDPGIIPLKIELTIGERDVLVLENHDVSDFLVGGIWVAPYETVSKQFYEPQSFVGLCTVTVGRDLVEIIVSEP